MSAGHPARNSRIAVAAAILGTAFFASQAALASSQSNTRKTKSFAQTLVESTHAKYPDTDEIGISTVTKRGCYGIASTDPSDIGEKCEKDDLEPIRTRKPFVEREGGGFDISLPLYGSAGKLIGSVGIGFKRSADESEAELTQKAKAIAREMSKQIPSKQALSTHAQ